MLGRLQSLLEAQREELLQELEDGDYDDLGTASVEEINKSMKLVGLFPDSFDEELKEFLLFLAIRHSKSLEEVDYKKFMKAFEEDFNLIEDGRSRWEDAEVYEPSSDEGELESDRSPSPVPQNEEAYEQSPDQEASLPAERPSGNVQDLEQNELLEKVDEILMQIVQRLPPTQKIRTLTHLMMPYLSPICDPTKQKQYLIISQNAFIQFLLGQNKNQLGLELDESHIICLLHLLVQEDEDESQASDLQNQTKFILYDEFIELVKTYMKKELIMQQSKSLGINYDILSKESVEFLFQVRSSLMYDNNQNINENSADEDDETFANRGVETPQKKPKSVPTHIREIFNRIVQRKSIALNRQKTDGKGLGGAGPATDMKVKGGTS